MHERYYLWGAGSIGKRTAAYLAPLGILSGIIDGDLSKHGQTICGLKVCAYDAVKNHQKEFCVIIAHFAPKETEELLDRDNVRHWRIAEFLTMWFWDTRRQNAVGFLDFPITTRCSLSCKDCMQYIPYRDKKDVPLEALKTGLDMLFRHISFVGEISIIGGEPLLHKQLSELLKYVRDNYRDKIGSLVITTNGTVTPQARVLELCRDTGVFISVSDYSKILPRLEGSIASLENAARESGVNIERKRWSWVDPGRFDAVTAPSNCTQTHMQLLCGKLWRCTLMAAGNAAGLCAADEGNDYFDLSRSNETAREFLNADVSQMKTTQCGKCLYPRGIAIPGAVQI